MSNRLEAFSAEIFSQTGKTPGWERGEDNLIIAQRKLGVYVYHVMWIDENGKVLYDQILRAESGGGVFLPLDESGRIGLIKQWRPQTRDPEKYAKRFPEIDFSELGRESWEVPRGFANTGESGARAARREAREETQSQIVTSEDLGIVCDNTAFSPHFTFLAWGELDPSRKPADKPDPNEKLLKGLQFFSRRELAGLQRSGKLYCQFTLSILMAFYFQHQEYFGADEGRSAGRGSVLRNRRDCGACNGTGKMLDKDDKPMMDADQKPIYCPICGGIGTT